MPIPKTVTTSAPTLSGEVAAARNEALDEAQLIAHTRADAARHIHAIAPVVASTGLFAVAAGLLAALGPDAPLSPLRLLIASAVYAATSVVQFEVGSGVAVPTQLVFVPMWFVVPPGLLPLVVFGATILGQLPSLARARVKADRILFFVVGCWFAVGPAVVLALAGDGAPSWHRWPVYAAALAAQMAINVVSMIPHVRALGFGITGQLRMMAPALGVDAALAPVGLALAFAIEPHTGAMLLILPLTALFAFFAKERQRRIDHALELSHAYRGTALLLGDVVEADDAYTGSHSRDVVELVLAVAERLGLPVAERLNAEFTALLHDVGKVKIPSEIINKAGPLDDDEWAVMRTHTIAGEEMLEKVGGLLGRVGRLVRSCHERWDGGGYPDGLVGDEIPLIARIVCCCDAFNAMVTDRSYRKALPLHEAIVELRRCSGTQFDPAVVDALIAVVA